MLAVSAMEPTVQFVFFLAAVILFAIAACGVVAARVNLVALGLACFAVPFMWNALAAS